MALLQKNTQWPMSVSHNRRRDGFPSFLYHRSFTYWINLIDMCVLYNTSWSSCGLACSCQSTKSYSESATVACEISALLVGVFDISILLIDSHVGRVFGGCLCSFSCAATRLFALWPFHVFANNWRVSPKRGWVTACHELVLIARGLYTVCVPSSEMITASALSCKQSAFKLLTLAYWDLRRATWASSERQSERIPEAESRRR